MDPHAVRVRRQYENLPAAALQYVPHCFIKFSLCFLPQK
jgi:hypothetical protein